MIQTTVFYCRFLLFLVPVQLNLAMHSIRTIILIIVLFASPILLEAQELKAKVTLMASRVSTTVDRKIFTTLQAQLNNFMNNRKWTNDVFKDNEKNHPAL